ncbi:MAG TPA: hypothetical protein VGK07_08825 [Candidatus Limnocylindria bacterium]|jgi:hypothetical protein
MTKTIKGLAFAAMLALALLASTNSAFAKDVRSGRETAWTDLGPVPTQPGGVTWETILQPLGVTWEE